MRILFISLLCSTLSYPTVAQDRPPPDDTLATHYQLPEADCALFPAAARLPTYLDYYMTRTGRFTPTQQQAAEAERALRGAQLEKLYDHRPSSYYAKYPAIIKAGLPKYQRQYYGFYNAAHQPCLYLNFFYEPNVMRSSIPVPYWLRAPIEMHDGGPAFWSIYYNLATHQLFDFSHNQEG